jgi:hypothetical protein
MGPAGQQQQERRLSRPAGRKGTLVLLLLPDTRPGFPPRGEACAVRWRLDGRDGPTLHTLGVLNSLSYEHYDC